MADGVPTGVLSDPIALTTVRSPQPAKTAGADTRDTIRDQPTARTSFWATVVAFVVVMFGGAELFFRTDLFWQIPLEHLLRNNRDLHMKAAWLVHHPPAPGSDEIIVLGSSTAAAIAELSGNESEKILRALADRPQLQLVSLANGAGCYPDHLTLLENALEHGHSPTAVILFSFPTCLGPYDETDALLARRMPLVSASLANLEESDRSLDVRIQTSLVRASAVERHRYFVNAWLRERWEALLLHGRPPWRGVVYKGDVFLRVWEGPWELFRYYAPLTAALKEWVPAAPASRHLGALVDLARQKGVPLLIIESPWSPPVFDALGTKAHTYFQAMQTIAARGGATYSDPNRSARLSPELFSDVNHVNHAGARAYMTVVASALHRLAQTR
jgi:hypothetical protein